MKATQSIEGGGIAYLVLGCEFVLRWQVGTEYQLFSKPLGYV